ncbi:C40 family peptidase [Neobacillus mesonae]|uniref:C40 family peptidase n=1 Tax=Neobacillus mesonae TaxID=1193713 RepID=UPI002041335B|nr:C40 family peptidase [Neobacillus mesonae]MCM3570118.1 C40 family peptidase [Neobacillus mesonae]
MFADRVIYTGIQHLGKPYIFNATPFQSNSFDCSSFIQYIFRVNGVSLPRNSRQQFQVGAPVPLQKIKKGDLLFFTTSARKRRKGLNRIGHVALYLGNGKILHTFPKSKRVVISKLGLKWRKVLIGAKRIY